MQAEERFTMVFGVETRYFEAGRGTTLLLVHGGEFGGNAELCWEENFDVLARDYHVVAPDLLGYGRTGKVVSFDDMRQYRLDHLWQLTRQIGLEEFWLIGNSAGASMCLELASNQDRYPGVLGVIGISGGGPNADNEARRILSDYDGSEEQMAAILHELFLDERYATGEYLKRKHAESIAPGAWEALAAARFGRPGGPRTNRHRVQPRFEAVDVPVLFIAGAQDRLKPPEEFYELASKINGAKVEIVDGARHSPHIEQAERVNELIRQFLAENS